MLARLALRVVMIALAAWAVPARAQVDRIAAVVNDEVITIHDLEARMRMAMALSNIPDSPEARRRVLPQVLRKMIDEKLQLKEAERLKISMTNAEVDQGIAMIEQQNRQPRGALLRGLQAAGVDASAVRDQVRADLLWLRVVGRVLRPQIKIGDEEVNDRLESIKARQGQPEYNIAEIYLPVETPDQEAEMRQLADRLLEQLKAGAPFPALARQFSRAPTAATGGAMGWVAQGMIDEDLLAAVADMNPGQVSPVIRAADGFHVMALIDRRIAGATADPLNATVSLARLVLPVPPGAPPKEQLLARARDLTKGANGCDQLDEVARRIGAPAPVRQPPVRVGELKSDLIPVVAALRPGEPAQPVITEEGITVTMVCRREDAATVQLPSPQTVRRMIEDERVDMLARRYLRDLRRSAFVDVRI
ncbi:MAG: peptidylprolyl isomerase [Pseudomonadota bacterium]